MLQLTNSRVRRFALVVSALWATLLAPPTALAHKPSDSYLTLSVGADDIVAGRWDIALRDLDYAVSLDADGDGKIIWGEVKTKQAEIGAYALARLDLASPRSACAPAFDRLLIDRHSDGAYAVLTFNAECPGANQALTIGYRLFSDIDPQHKGLLSLTSSEGLRTYVFSPEAATRTFSNQAGGVREQLLSYFVTGLTHIGTGDDHILFLLTLLLPAVFTRRDSRWAPAQSLWASVRETLKVVTAFTAAHALTLSLSAFGVWRAPSRLSESAIALSIAIAAANNLRPFLNGRRWAIAFGFGLVHGFGFANILADLALPTGLLTLALLGFNAGVEAGQLLVVALIVPYIYLVRKSLLYRGAVFTGGSLATILIASVWFVERALNLQLISGR